MLLLHSLVVVPTKLTRHIVLSDGTTDGQMLVENVVEDFFSLLGRRSSPQEEEINLLLCGLAVHVKPPLFWLSLMIAVNELMLMARVYHITMVSVNSCGYLCVLIAIAFIIHK